MFDCVVSILTHISTEILSVTLKSAKNFIVDILPRQFVYKPVYITVDNDQWDDVAFEIKPLNNLLSVSGNRLITNNAGTYFIDIIRKGNFMYKSLTKNIKSSSLVAVIPVGAEADIAVKLAVLTLTKLPVCVKLLR